MEKKEKQYSLLLKDKEEKKIVSKKYTKAWSYAREAASYLKENYSVNDVYIFGSLVDKKRFTINSDIDLAVTGLAPNNYYAAVGAVTKIILDYKVDLVDLNDCQEYLKEAILREGVKI